MNSYQFSKPYPLAFYGGRWDGMEITGAMQAPEVIFVSPTGQGVAPAVNGPPPLPGWTPYVCPTPEADMMARLPVRYFEAEEIERRARA